MHKTRIQNIFLAIVATLLLVNLGVMLSPAVHAIPKTQYKAVILPNRGSADATPVQHLLDEQSAEGWQYAGSVSAYLIFKK